MKKFKTLTGALSKSVGFHGKDMIMKLPIPLKAKRHLEKLKKEGERTEAAAGNKHIYWE